MNPNAIQRILETGLLGALLLICGGIIFFLYKELKHEKNERLKDFKEINKEDIKLRIESKNTLDILKNTINIMLEILRGKK